MTFETSQLNKLMDYIELKENRKTVKHHYMLLTEC